MSLWRITILLMVASIASACRPKYERNWHELRRGMDEHEVWALLGSPTMVHPAWISSTTRPSDATMLRLYFGDHFDRERWAYGPRGWFGGWANLFGPSRDAYVIYFDPARRVERWRPPLDPDAPDPRASARDLFHTFARAICADDGAAQVLDWDQWSTPATGDDPPGRLEARHGEPDYVILDWSRGRSDGGARYAVQIGGTPASPRRNEQAVFPFDWLTFATPRTSIKLRFIPGEDPQTKWFWRVRRLDEVGASDWSAWQHIPPRRSPTTAAEPAR